jgi:hypothetical protein
MYRECPQWFQDRLQAAGGSNQYGGPLFKLAWGQSETMRTGGYFARDGFVGYRTVPAIGGEACWAIMMWESAESMGSAERWYRDYSDAVTGLCDLGQYPFHGRYRVLQKLIHREMVGGEWVVSRMEPTHFIVDIMLPMLKAWQRLTNEAKLKAIEQEMELEQAEYLRMAKDSRDSHRVRRGSALVQKKVEFLERNMKMAMQMASRTQLGMRQAAA